MFESFSVSTLSSISSAFFLRGLPADALDPVSVIPFYARDVPLSCAARWLKTGVREVRGDRLLGVPAAPT